MREPVHMKLLRALLWLYPPSFRRRNGARILALARALPGRTLHVTTDALLTLARAWRDVAVDVARTPLRATAAASAFVQDAWRSGVCAVVKDREHAQF